MPARDIDYAATAVESALHEKFGRQNDLTALKVAAGVKTISVTDGDHAIEGSRDDLLARLRRCGTYAEWWL